MKWYSLPELVVGGCFIRMGLTVSLNFNVYVCACVFLPSLLTNTLLMNIKMQLRSQKLCITYLHKLRIWCVWRKFALLWHLTQNTRSEKGEVRYGLCMFCLYFRHLACPFSRHFVLFQAILCYLNKNVKLRINNTAAVMVHAFH